MPVLVPVIALEKKLHLYKWHHLTRPRSDLSAGRSLCFVLDRRRVAGRCVQRSGKWSNDCLCGCVRARLFNPLPVGVTHITHLYCRLFLNEVTPLYCNCVHTYTSKTSWMARNERGEFNMQTIWQNLYSPRAH